MFGSLLRHIFPNSNSRILASLEPMIARINDLEPSMMRLEDAELTARSLQLRQELAQHNDLNRIIPEAFALVREAARRELGQRHYDVQLLGGLVLCQGKIAEMKTGEGKTLTATLALYANALTGRGAHLVTVNDYLARRDAEWMAPVFQRLGMTVGILQNSTPDHERAGVYRCDIVYATNNELGFDYLRDNMKFRLQDYVQRELNFAIVDEVDSILIDEARTPLIISGASDESSGWYERINMLVARLQAGPDYEVDEKQRNVQLTEAGNDTLERALSVGNLYDLQNIKILHHINVALKAHALFKRDVDYVVRDGAVQIVDEFTGRILPGRRYSDGLHQAIEAKEGVIIQSESQTVASITLQNYFRLYDKLAGMTGTAATEAEEFHNIYKLEVVIIPTHRPMVRDDKSDLLFMSQTAKERAIVKDVLERHAKGQPVLVGTTSVEGSERLSAVLRTKGIDHDVLNAKNHAREAEIVALAGEPGRITIATNMAGRGTDIKLPAASLQAGGLYILGTERHESRRIDNQLRGRSGRQGDPGESRFYLSPDDHLIRIFGGDTFKNRIKALSSLPGMSIDEDEVLESAFFSKQIERMQERVERDNFEVRKHLLEYDDVLNQQRKVVYALRRAILEEGDALVQLMADAVRDATRDMIEHASYKGYIEESSWDGLIHALHGITAISVAELKNALPYERSESMLAARSEQFIESQVAILLQRHSETSEQREQFLQAVKWLLLNALDNAWRQHMLNLDHLKEGIGLRGMGQKNPLTEYKREAFHAFEDMLKSVRAEAFHHLFKLSAAITVTDTKRFEQERARDLQAMQLSGPTEAAVTAEAQPAVQRKTEAAAGRNENCPCGSGKKYKKCCGK